MRSMETPKHETPEHFGAEVVNYIQLGLLRRYLERELGPDYEAHDRKSECEMRWIKDHAPKFRSIFEKNKDTFLKFYKENRDELIDAVEEMLDQEQ